MKAFQFASSDDLAMWDLHFSAYVVPVLTASIELGIFDALAKEAASAEQLAERCSFNCRAMRVMLPYLSSLGLLAQHQGQYHLAEVARNYLVTSSPTYWGPVLAISREPMVTHQKVLEAARAPESTSAWDVIEQDKASSAWSLGALPPELARAIALYMNTYALPSAAVAARVLDLRNTSRLMDVGAGSGCFSIAFATENPALHCTLMDLAPMCDEAATFVNSAGLGGRIHYAAVDMFREKWPTGHDAIFFSNIFHDWDFATCRLLAKKAYEVLPQGGRIHIHEMLLDDTRNGPKMATAFSVLMLLGTKGQQFAASELVAILTAVGFKGCRITPGHGHHAIVTAEK
jgi:hypothetical protein